MISAINPLEYLEWISVILRRESWLGNCMVSTEPVNCIHAEQGRITFKSSDSILRYSSKNNNQTFVAAQVSEGTQITHFRRTLHYRQWHRGQYFLEIRHMFTYVHRKKNGPRSLLILVAGFGFVFVTAMLISLKQYTNAETSLWVFWKHALNGRIELEIQKISRITVFIYI